MILVFWSFFYEDSVPVGGDFYTPVLMGIKARDWLCWDKMSYIA